jgi:hypothetical protein
MFRGQAEQDKFVLTVLDNRRNGTFVEIGSCHPININNSFLLESSYGWNGIMIEIDNAYLPLYRAHRPNSVHVIQDATTINYSQLFQTSNMPNSIDYLQIDLLVENRSTLATLEKLNNEVFDAYTFATVTFEHDIYRGNYFDTRAKSREIFAARGYVRVFSDISNESNSFEDWYVHPTLVNMDYVTKLMEANGSNPINWNRIKYPQK